MTSLIKPNFKGKIGFEVECVYKRINEDLIRELYLNNRWQKSCDGSIRTSPTFPNECEIKFHYDLKELNSNLPKIKKLLELVKSGEDYHCGLHMHISFEEICNYYKLTCWKFVKYFQEKYSEYAKNLEERSRINNPYCKFYPNKELFIVNTDYQLRATGKNERYWCVNFNSFNIHNTIEFRIFTGTDKYSRFTDNINFLIKTINEFLNEQKEIAIGIIKDTPEKSKPKVIRKYVGEDLEKVEEEIMKDM